MLRMAWWCRSCAKTSCDAVEVQRPPYWHNGLTIPQLEQQIHLLETQDKNFRLTQWRSKLRTSTNEVFRWLRRKPSYDNHQVYNGAVCPNDVCSTSSQSALDKIRSFWDGVWHRAVTDEEIPAQAYFNEYNFPKKDEVVFNPVDLNDLIRTAKLQRHKAGSTDGWSGLELALLPHNVWAAIHQIFRIFEDGEFFPSNWAAIRQIHLRKPKPGRDSDGAINAADLRPISIMSCFWRVFISAKMKGPEMSNWYDSSLAVQQYGCRRKRDSVQALTPLAVAWAQNHILGSLDLSQAFDRIRPSLAVDFLFHSGFPSKFGRAIRSLWQTQTRCLQYLQNSSRDLARVTESIPQGCPFSPWTLNVILAFPLQYISNLTPRAKHIVYVDDRSFAAATAEECHVIQSQWSVHSSRLGLKENLEKTQIAARSAKQRAAASSIPEMAPYVKDSLHALGVCFASRNAKPTPKQKKRIQAATDTAIRVRAAPVVAEKRIFVAAAASTSKAAFGWVLRSPPNYLINPLHLQLRRAGWNHRVASTPLVHLLAGHTLDVKFMSGTATLSAIYRAHKLEAQPSADWDLKGGFSSRLRLFLRQLDWVEQSPWKWALPELQVEICLDPRDPRFTVTSELLLHEVRTSWRLKQWKLFLAQNRRDAIALRGTPFPSDRLKAAQAAFSSDSHSAAILTGAMVSPQRAQKIGLTHSASCPFCQFPSGTTNHIFWECPATNPDNSQPHDLLERLLGWPGTQLRRLAQIRKHMLSLRYDSV